MAIDTTSESMLVADDDFDSRELLADLLRHEFPGAEVLTARDGQEALAIAVQRDARAVILDLEMPVLDGMGAARGIRAALGVAAPILLAVSGSSQKLAEAAAQTLFDHYLMKPVEIAQLFGYLRARK